MTSQDLPNTNAACPRCERAFVCRADQIALCECAYLGIQVSPEIREKIANDYKGCLCNPCLTELATQWDKSSFHR